MATELAELLKKQLQHLRELGVEGIRVPTEAPVKPIQRVSVDSFEQIHQEIGDCTRCPLHQERTHVVHTGGSSKSNSGCNCKSAKRLDRISGFYEDLQDES